MTDCLALTQSTGTVEEQDLVLREMKSRLEDVTHNYHTLLGEWHKLQEELKADQVPKDYVLVHKNDLAQLATETSQLKLNLPKVINSGLSTATTRVDSLQEEVDRLRQQNTVAEADIGQWKSRFEAAVAECQKEKESNLQLRCELQELTEQLSQQSDYSSSLGSSCCTLLWRVSRSQDTVQTLLSGTKIDDFINLVTSTVESYVSAYKDDWPQDQSDESGFILALVGIITNVAASAYGRDFLISRDSGRHLVGTFTNFLADAPLKKSARLKNLLLMALYNLSINQRALKYICSKPGIMGLLAWHLQEEPDCDNRLNTLRVVHSLVSDEHNNAILHELAEALPEHFLQQLTADKNQDVQDLALDLIMDLRQTKHEQ
ncbi:heat shock factor 2-binding protein-like [Haliotis rubra]|uniref:heat shock factor 2-binding protein-like n=1 Tax=Haliotis rubra TaxID=36100 RepID=UPI001EE5FBDD|nr:heat shock factor 2-binding protein-like [Haliotis rubra]